MKIAFLKQNSNLTTILAAFAAFGAYTCMYALRKPFTACQYDDIFIGGYHYKVVLVMIQLLGYMCSKFIGIKFISQQNKLHRAFFLISFMLLAWLALLGFALVPPPYNIVFLFFNGLPLGMIWGLLFSYLEGRKTTDLMGAILAITFIFSSGWVKSIGKWVISANIANVFWMPFVVGGFFMLPLLLFIFILEQIPPPSKEDIQLRSPRDAMTKQERQAILKQHGLGICLLILTYVLLTIHRDIRDNFAADIWAELGLGKEVHIFTQTEIPISLIVLGVLSLFVFIKNNYYSLVLSHIFVIVGLVLALISTFLFHHHFISPFYWMTSVGIGLYMGYIPFNILFFERLLATFKYVGNVGFLMYLADAFGYLGSIGALFIKEFLHIKVLWYQLFELNTYLIGFLGIALMIFSLLYFRQKYRLQR